VSLADASDILGVSVERVRQLVVAGGLPGTRFGNAWAVPREALVARRHSPGSGGRPLSALHAWREIVAGTVDLGRAGRYQRRAHLVRCEMSRATVDSLPQLLGAVVGGVRAAIEHGSSLSVADGSDLYLSQRAFEQLASRLASVADPLGAVRLRIVADEAWALIPPGELAPRAAVALDLLDSADPRHWIAAERLIRDG
jgi:excisionase family DNA binding protein